MGSIWVIAVGRLGAACICAYAAYTMAMAGKEGWGWFLFVALLLGGMSVSVTDEKGDK